jgi:hypothetical protein
MQIAIYVDVDDATNLDKLLPLLARECVKIDAALEESGIQAEAFVQSVVLSDGTVLLD